jgi:hypothetical protein
MPILNSARACALGLLLATSAVLPASAADLAGYSKLVTETLQSFISGKVDNIPALVAKQDAAIEIGIAACTEHAATHPDVAKLLQLVIASVPKMKTMSAEKLEDVWGDEGTGGDEIGMPLSKIGQFGEVRNFLDLIVHPARARAYLTEFQASKSKSAIDEAKAELVEVLEHVKKIEAQKG